MDSRIFQKFRTLKEYFDLGEEPWEYTEEPHTSRRKEILAKHPEIKRLMGYDNSITYIVLAEVFIQLVICNFVHHLSWGPLFLLAYVVGGTFNHSLGSAIHEIGHNLAYGHAHPLKNRILGMICNFPMAIPLSVTYKKYHADHHRYLGNKDLDADVPTRIECILFRHPATRVIWLIMHPLIHAVRPFAKKPEPLTKLEFANWVTQAIFDLFILYYFGFKAFVYLLSGTLLGLGLHPLSGHFISEHYMFNKGQATLSYYGSLNPILFNVGYHVEHHDFPYIPWHKLPELRKIAPEYYDNLPYHTSWVKVLWDFIFDPNMGPQGHGFGYFSSDISALKNKNENKPALTSKTKTWQTNGVHQRNGCKLAGNDKNFNKTCDINKLYNNGKVRQ